MLDIGKTVEVDHFYFIIGGSLSHYQVDQFYIDKRTVSEARKRDLKIGYINSFNEGLALREIVKALST
jgi:hypothetical protein